MLWVGQEGRETGDCSVNQYWDRWGVLPHMKIIIHILYIAMAMMRAGMYYRFLSHPATILFGF